MLRFLTVSDSHLYSDRSEILKLLYTLGEKAKEYNDCIDGIVFAGDIVESLEALEVFIPELDSFIQTKDLIFLNRLYFVWGNHELRSGDLEGMKEYLEEYEFSSPNLKVKVLDCSSDTYKGYKIAGFPNYQENISDFRPEFSVRDITSRVSKDAKFRSELENSVVKPDLLITHYECDSIEGGCKVYGHFHERLVITDSIVCCPFLLVREVGVVELY